jgi:putative addiction module component (TIGR02574 family)
MNAKVALKDILALSEEDRRWLVEEIAASLPEQEEDIELTPEFKAELERRMAEFEKNPDNVVSWDEIKHGLEKRFPR